MWIFFPNAMLSIVAHRDKPDTLMVRARFAGDIERVFPRAQVCRTPSADYLYRAEVSRIEATARIGEALASMTYTNVKGAIAVGDGWRYSAMHDVWDVMHRAQLAAEPFAGMDATDEVAAPPPELHTGDYFAHTTWRGEPRMVAIHAVQERVFGEPDVTLEYLESGRRVTTRYTNAQNWLRNSRRVA